MDPVNRVESVPPNVSSPFSTDKVVVGSKNTERRSAGIIPCKKRLSVTVGTGVFESGDKVPIVKSTGPSLRNKYVSNNSQQWRFTPDPRTPSKPEKPDEAEPLPIDWF
jgi:hypothetical protein